LFTHHPSNEQVGVWIEELFSVIDVLLEPGPSSLGIELHQPIGTITTSTIVDIRIASALSDIRMDRVFHDARDTRPILFSPSCY
jgi:hypothetical protein